MDNIGAILMSVIPSIGLGLLFWYVMRIVIRADRNERAAIAAQEAALASSERESAPEAGEGGPSADAADRQPSAEAPSDADVEARRDS